MRLYINLRGRSKEPISLNVMNVNGEIMVAERITQIALGVNIRLATPSYLRERAASNAMSL